jgi:hypothetical protein
MLAKAAKLTMGAPDRAAAPNVLSALHHCGKNAATGRFGTGARAVMPLSPRLAAMTAYGTIRNR